jgi:large subunit ribosomal protein L7A
MKQVRKALDAREARKIYLARDAEPHVTTPLKDLCRETGIEVDFAHTMEELGTACEIDVGTAAAALLKF